MAIAKSEKKLWGTIMMKWLLIATCLYTILNLIIGLWKTKEDSFESFVGYRNRSSTLLIFLSINATFIGGGMFFAVGQMGYEGGLVPLVLAACTSLGLIGFTIISSKIRSFCDKNGVVTLYDYIELRLSNDPKWGKFFTSLIVCINISLYFFLLAGQFLVLSFFVESFTDASSKNALIISVSIIFANTLIYGIVGGLKKDILTDSFQMIMVIGGMAIISINLLSAESISLLSSTSFASTNKSFGNIFIIGSLLFFTPSFMVRYDLWQRALSAASNKSLIKAVVFSIPLVFTAYALFVSVGIYARNLDVANSQFASIQALREMLSPSLFIVASLALFAAVMSSADTFLNITSTSIHRLAAGKPKQENSKRDLYLVRVLTLIICLTSMSLAILSPDIVNLMIGAFSSLVITTPAIIYVLLSSNPNAKVSFFSTSIGYLSFLAIFFMLPGLQKTAFVYATLIALIIFLIGQSSIFLLKKMGQKAL